MYYNTNIASDILKYIIHWEVLVMDIASLSISMNTAKVTNDVGVAVLSKSLDTYEQQGESLTRMMEASVTPYLGPNIDCSI